MFKYLHSLYWQAPMWVRLSIWLLIAYTLIRSFLRALFVHKNFGSASLSMIGFITVMYFILDSFDGKYKII